MRFRYVAYTMAQGVVRGHIQARDQAEARAELLQQGYRLLVLRPGRSAPALEDLFPSLFKVSTAELVRFSQHLAAMLTSGGGLLRALEMFHEESRNKVMRRTLEAILKRLGEGGSLSIAMQEHPTVFSPLFVSVVEVGENTGRLGPALEQMADMLEKGQEARQKVIRTMMYPAAIILLALVTMSVLMLVAIPPMLKVFSSMGADVPLITRISVASFRLIRENFLTILVGAVVGAVALALVRRIPRVRYWMDALQAKSPILGTVVVASELSRLARTISLLLEAGVPLDTALRLAITGCGNQVLRRAFSEAEESLVSGHGLTAALKRYPIIPKTFVELVMIGEESNSLQRAMKDTSATYQKQLERRLDSLLSLLEPASTLVIGAIVGLLAFSMFLPIYSGLKVFK